MKTVKIIDGQVMVCELLTPNFDGEYNPHEPRWYVGALQEAVSKRMDKCLRGLNEAMGKQQIVSIEEVEVNNGLTQHIRYSTGGGFVVASYETLEALFNKFTNWLECGRERVSYDTLSNELSYQEADQLFKSFVDRSSWTNTVAMFDILRYELLRKQGYETI